MNLHCYNTRLNAKNLAEWPSPNEQWNAVNSIEKVRFTSSYDEFPIIPNEHHFLTFLRWNRFYDEMVRLKQEELLQRPLIQHMHALLDNKIRPINQADADFLFTTRFIFHAYVALNFIMDRCKHALTKKQWRMLSYYCNGIEKHITSGHVNCCLYDLYEEYDNELGCLHISHMARSIFTK